MTHTKKQLDEEIKRKQKIFTYDDKKKIEELEDSLIRAMLEKVSFSLCWNQWQRRNFPGRLIRKW